MKGTPASMKTLSSQGSSRKRKKKSATPKDLNAGLTIPPLLSTPKLGNKKFELQKSAISHNLMNLFDNKKELPETRPINVLRKHSLKDKKTLVSQARVSEQKEMSKLKSALFKSNEDSKKSAPSLLNFFS